MLRATITSSAAFGMPRSPSIVASIRRDHVEKLVASIKEPNEILDAIENGSDPE